MWAENRADCQPGPFRLQAVTNIAHGLITDLIAQMGQSPGNPVIAPGAILLCHLHDQVFQLFLDAGATEGFPLRGTIKLLGHQLAMPAQDGVGLRNVRDFLQRLLPQLLAELGSGCAFGGTQMQTTCDLVA